MKLTIVPLIGKLNQRNQFVVAIKELNFCGDKKKKITFIWSSFGRYSEEGRNKCREENI